MKKPFNFRLALFLAIALITGIVSGYLFLVESIVFAVLLLLISIFLLFFILFYKADREIIKKRLGIVIALGVFLLSGLLSFTFQTQTYVNADLNYHQYQIQGRVSEVYSTNNGVYTILEEVSIKGERSGPIKYSVGLYVYGENIDNISMGSIISFSAKLNDYGIIYQDRFSAENISQGVKYTASVDIQDVTIVGYNLTIFQRVNLFIKTALKKGLSEQSFPIAYALLTGHSGFIDADVISAFRSTGVAHVFAVSGLHIGFVFTLLKFVLDKLKVNKWASVVIIALTLFFYCGVCEFSSSSIRATIMCLVALTVKNSGLKYDGLTSLSISAIIILLLNPCELFCIGFQLSFVVVLGIIILSKPIEKLLKFLPKKLANALAVVLSAQIVSVPLLLIAFGNLSLISVACNLIFIPVVAVVYVTTFILTIIGGLFGISYITLWIMDWVFKGLSFLATVTDYTIFTIDGISLGFSIVFYFLAILFSSGLIALGKKPKFIISLSMALLFGVSAIMGSVVASNQTKVYISGSNNFCFTFVSSSGENILIINDVYVYSSVSSLQKIKNNSRQGVLNYLIIPKQVSNCDIQIVLSKVLSVFDVGNLYYYGQVRQTEEDAITLSFGDEINVVNFEGDIAMPTVNVKCKFVNNGYAVHCEKDGKKLIAYSRFGDNFFIQNLTDKYSFDVAVDYVERIYANLYASTKYSYLWDATYLNASSQGYILEKLV